MANSRLYQLVDRLPEGVVRRIEDGVPVTLVVMKEGDRLDVREIDPAQAWFWTPDWQAVEREADEEIATGQGTVYASDEELLEHLDSLSAAPK